MTTPVFPTLPGLAFPVKRTSNWSTTVQKAVSGKRTAIANWTYPQYQWELTYDALFSSKVRPEFQTLMGFFNQMQGRAGTFLFTDPDDNQVAGQIIGVGDGIITTFQLVRAMGYVEPIFAPNQVSAVYVNGVAINDWTVGAWDSDTPGIVTLGTAPPVGAIVSVDFTYFFAVWFADDSLTLEKFAYQLWLGQKVSFYSEK